MDENYLDNLLNEVSLDKEIDDRVESELDNQLYEEKRQYQEENAISDEDLFNMGLERDATTLQQDNDLIFSEEQMDELDQLDNLADLDIGDMDFSDIDFDDLDITKLDNVGAEDLDDLLKGFEGDLEIPNFQSNTNQTAGMNSTTQDAYQESVQHDETPQYDTVSQYDEIQQMEENTSPAFEETVQSASLNEDTFDTDTFLDSFLEPEEEQNQDDIQELPEESLESFLQEEALEDTAPSTDAAAAQETDTLSAADTADLDDLLSMLDLDDSFSGMDEQGDLAAQSEILSETEPADNQTEVKTTVEKSTKKDTSKKKTFMEILFGEPDEDDIITPEEMAEMEAKKAAKKAKKDAAKAAKKKKSEETKQEKTVKNAQKKKDDEAKKRVKAEKKARKRALEAEDIEPEKSLNKPAVIFIFTLLLGGVFLLYMASNNFDYTLAIENATKYFANQKYRKAYDEIAGVEVKQKDEDLKNRIYTVMYVERLYESYLNNIELDRPEKALDALLRGVDKYYEHYDEAEQLGITSDLDYSFNQIKEALSSQYGITVEEAVQINSLSNYEYVKQIETILSQKEEGKNDSNTGL